MRSFNVKSVLYNIPFSYFAVTRLTQARDWVFHFWNEWLINNIILWYCAFVYVNTFDAYLQSTKNFLLAYIAFISFYEIGYIVNDLFSVKKEEQPRLRFSRFIVSDIEIGMWILVRIIVFLLISYHYSFPDQWLLFYFCLGTTFFLHNYLNSKALKTFTFIQLAFFRFWAPVFLFIPATLFFALVPVICLFYMFSRTLTYMDSKGLLVMPDRNLASFRLGANAVLLLFSLFWSYYCSSWFPLLVSLYYVFFWVIAVLSGKK